jgi:hypothetical protein
MTEEATETTPVAQAQAAAQYPPMPEVVPIPPQAVREWVQLPEDEPLRAELTRRDVDNLFFSIQKLISATDSLAAALIYARAGNEGKTAESLDAHQRNAIEAGNRLRQFMAGIMLSATRAGRG